MERGGYRFYLPHPHTLLLYRKNIFKAFSPWSLASVVEMEKEAMALWPSPSSYTDSNQQMILSYLKS